VRVIVDKKASRVVVRLVPRRVMAIRPILLAVVWAALTAAAIATMVAKKGAFIFLPIIAIPVKRIYRPLAATLNRITIAVDESRVSVRQGPLPVHRPLTLATRDVCEIRVRELGEPVGGWFVTGTTFDWTLWVRTYAEGGPTLALALPDRDVAERAASALNEAIHARTIPSSYR
jgi:hypothetical protein